MSTDTRGGKEESASSLRRLYRLPERGIVAGVAAGLAEYLKMDVTVMRLLFIVAIFITNGLAIIVYFVAVLVMPTPEEEALNSKNVNSKVEGLVQDIETSVGSSGARKWIGLGLIVFGIWTLGQVLLPGFIVLNWNIVWPALLIIIGLYVLTKGRR